MLNRFKHWRTTTAGVVIGGVVLVVFKSFGCQVPGDWIAWLVGILPAILGALALDRSSSS